MQGSCNGLPGPLNGGLVALCFTQRAAGILSSPCVWVGYTDSSKRLMVRAWMKRAIREVGPRRARSKVLSRVTELGTSLKVITNVAF